MGVRVYQNTTSIPKSILCNSQIKIFHDAKILTNMYNTKYMIFTTIGSDVVIQLANLPLLILTPLALTCHAMVTRWSRTERTVLIEVDIVVKRQIDSGLAWSVLLSKTILVITNVKICCGITRRSILTALFFFFQL